MLSIERETMICSEIISSIEKKYPKNAALEWDNVGLLAGRNDKEVKKIYIALDLTDGVIARAIEAGVDMIITHHPMIFAPIKRVTDETLCGRRLITLIQQDICYYAMHTNYDVLGMAELSGQKLGLLDAEVLEITTDTGEGIGRIGTLPERVSLEKCCELVKQAFEIPDVKVFGDLDKEVYRVAISPGSGKSMIACALEKKADVLIAGDFDHHSGLDAVDMGLAIVDAGHYGTEYMFVADVCKFLKDHMPEIEICAEETNFPFVTL